jgi:hypothetical protein
VLRLAGCVLTERQHDEWDIGDGRYLSEHSMWVLTATERQSSTWTSPN